MKIAISQIDTNPRRLDSVFERMLSQLKAAHAQQADIVVFGLSVFGGVQLTESFAFDNKIVELMGRFADFAKEAPVACLVPIIMGAAPEDWDLIYVHDGMADSLRAASIFGTTPESVRELLMGEEAGRSGARDVVSPIADGMGLVFHIAGMDVLAVSHISALTQAARLHPTADLAIYFSPFGVNTNDEMSTLAPSVSDGCFVKEASELGMWLVAVGGVGGYIDQVFGGGSFAMAPWGELACVLPGFEEALAYAEIDPLSEGPLSDPVDAPAYRRIECLWNAIVLGTRDYLGKEGITDALLLLEGDVLSSVCAAILVDALGPTHVHAVPVSAATGEGCEDALALARNLRLDAEGMEGVGLGPAPAEASSSDAALSLNTDLAGCQVYAAHMGWAYISSRDKTGFALEAEDLRAAGALFAPLGDVWRTDVSALARYRNTVSPVIPEGALARLRVPALSEISRAGNTAEAQLNAIDAMMLLSVERAASADVIVQTYEEPELVAELLERMESQEVFRRGSCIYPVLSDRTLSERDWASGGAVSAPATARKEDARPESEDDAVERLRESLAANGDAPIEEQISDIMKLLLELGIAVIDEEDPTSLGGLFPEN